MATTAAQKLAALDDLIDKRLAGGLVKSYTVLGRSVNLDDLDAVFRARKELLQMIQEESSGGLAKVDLTGGTS